MLLTRDDMVFEQDKPHSDNEFITNVCEILQNMGKSNETYDPLSH